jgi:hypothetical protein
MPIVIGMVHLLGVLQVLQSSPAAGAATGVQSPRPRRLILGHPCRCPLGMRVILSIGLHCSCFSCSCSEVEGEYFGDKSPTFVTPIVR